MADEEAPPKFTAADVGRRVRYLDGTPGTIASVTENYVLVAWDPQPSPTSPAELEFA